MRNLALRILGSTRAATILSDVFPGYQRAFASSSTLQDVALKTKPSKTQSLNVSDLPKLAKKTAIKENVVNTLTIDDVSLPFTRQKSVENDKAQGEQSARVTRRSAKRAPTSRVLTDAMLEKQYRQAVAAHKIPHTELSRVVFKNQKRFPGCVVLTRVGKFYESYYDAALELVDLLGLNLAWRVYSKPKSNPKTRKGKTKAAALSSDVQEVGIKVDSRYPFAGFPISTLDKYLKILVQDRGRTVVLVEESDGIVDLQSEGRLKHRKVGRVVTPGTIVDASWLSGDESRYLLSIAISDTAPKPTGENDRPSLPLWLAYTDVSTGEFFSKSTTLAELENELARISPREVVLDESMRDLWEGEAELRTPENFQTAEELLSLLRVVSPHVSFADTYHPPALEQESKPIPPTSTSDDFLSLEAQATSLLQHHLLYALREHMPPLSIPERQTDSDYMHIDAATINALEIRHAVRLGNQSDPGRGSPLSVKGTLLSVIDKTVSDSGRRLLNRTLTAPLTSTESINERQDLVQAFLDREELRYETQSTLKSLKDVMRFVQRFRGNQGNATDLWRTGQWIRGIEQICQRIKIEIAAEQERASELGMKVNAGIRRLQEFVNSIHDLDPLATKIELYINEESVKDDGGQVINDDMTEDDEISTSSSMFSSVPPMDAEVDGLEAPPSLKANLAKTWKLVKKAEIMENRLLWINPNYSNELQLLHDKLAKLDKKKEDMELRLRGKFEIPDSQLLLLTKSPKLGHHLLVPNPEDRLKITKARGFEGIAGNSKAVFYGPWTDLAIEREEIMAKALTVQFRASKQIFQMVTSFSNLIQHNAAVVDELDLAMSFAQTADDMGYVRPFMTSGTEYKVLNGRHPVVEAALHSSARLFVPNTTEITPSSHLHVITGPNQGGKSTFLRQTAMIAILAQSGSFVPADAATIGVIDKVFSRVGARDDLYRDRSTFMLEMVETAGILRGATERSLVIMDEIGRGTTLNAGMSIAYATLDYILSKIKCRTLFATHYHELGAMLGVDESDKRTKDGAPRAGVEFWCTDVDEVDGAFSYSYRLKRGLNFNSHAILAARLAGMPRSFLRTATNVLETLQEKKRALDLLADEKVQKEQPSGKKE